MKASKNCLVCDKYTLHQVMESKIRSDLEKIIKICEECKTTTMDLKRIEKSMIYCTDCEKRTEHSLVEEEYSQCKICNEFNIYD